MGVHFYRFHCLCPLFDVALIKFLNIYFALENATSKQNVHGSDKMNVNPRRWVGGNSLDGPNEACIAITL